MASGLKAGRKLARVGERRALARPRFVILLSCLKAATDGGPSSPRQIDFPHPYPSYLSPGMPPAAPGSPFWPPSARPTSAGGFPPAGAAAARDGPAIWRPPSPPGVTHPSSSCAYAEQATSAKRRRTDSGVQSETGGGKAKGCDGMHADGPFAAASGGQRHALHPNPLYAGPAFPLLSSLGSSEPHPPPTHPAAAATGSRAGAAAQVPSSNRRVSTASSTTSRAGSGPGPAKRLKKPTASAAMASPAASTSSAPAPLLTAAQKKANHIASEQKRRANIKRGHDQLCEIVPALRNAIAEAERKEREGLAAGSGAARAKKKGKCKKGKKGDDGGEEKVDGRAGPKSEGTVLLRSESCLLCPTPRLLSLMTPPDPLAAIEHIRALQGERLALLARLSAARRAAQARFNPADHEALRIADGQTIAEEDDWGGDIASGSEDDG